MSLVLYGPTKLGKTTWARSLGSHLYFCGLYSGKEALRCDEAEYAIFDDIQGGIKFFHGFKNWLGCQQEFQVKVLYKDPVSIKWGKPSIWLAQRDPREDIEHYEDRDWLEGNCIFQEVTEPIAIFHASRACSPAQ